MARAFGIVAMCSPKALHLSGFDATGDVTAAPSGGFASSRPDDRRRCEDDRLRVIEEKTGAAREELGRGDGARWRARRRLPRGDVDIGLPRPLGIDDSPIRSVLLCQGVNEELLAELRARPVEANL